MSTIAPRSGREATPASPQANAAQSSPNVAASAQPPASGLIAGDTAAVVLDLSERARMIMARAQADQLAAERPQGPSSLRRAGDLGGNGRQVGGGAPAGARSISRAGSVGDGGAISDADLSDADLAVKYQDQIAWTARAFDKYLPPEKGQALRAALANRTLKFQAASEVAGLNTQTSVSYAPGGGQDLSVATSSYPSGAVKNAIDQGDAFVFWTSDRGDVYVTW